MGASKKYTKKGLTVKELEMCRLYVSGGFEFAGNQTRCFEKVFVNPEKQKFTQGSLWTMASKKFKKPEIQVAIKEMLEELDEKWVKTRLKELSESSERPADRIRAVELMGKTHAMFTDKVEEEVKISQVLLDDEE